MQIQIVTIDENETRDYAFELQRKLLDQTADYERQLHQVRQDQEILVNSCRSL
jgi:hypothetical protein